jgi:hypothetical protein
VKGERNWRRSTGLARWADDLPHVVLPGGPPHPEEARKSSL